MTDEGWARSNLDLHIAHPARVYDYWLGGKDNFAADREVAERVLEIVPEIRQSVRANRAFLRRAVLAAAEAGVEQFLDLGSGLPTAENTHDIARRARPGAHVVYVDNDPIVSVHGNALLAGAGATTVVHADVRDPQAVLGHQEVRRHIDFGKPVAVLLLGVLHFVPGDQDPYGVVAQFGKALAPGSRLILSHLTGDADPQSAKRFLDAVNQEARAVVRTRDEVERFFDGFELLDPGVVPVDQWRPDGPEAMERFWLWAGVGRKP